MGIKIKFHSYAWDNNTTIPFILAQILELNGSPCKVSITGYHYRYLRRCQFYRFQDDIASLWIVKELD